MQELATPTRHGLRHNRLQQRPVAEAYGSTIALKLYGVELQDILHCEELRRHSLSFFKVVSCVSIIRCAASRT